jgi:hypothetical protein
MTDDAADQRYDSEGDSIAFDALVIQAIELLNTFIGKNMLRDFVSDANNASSLLFLLVGYAQMTAEEQDLFESDPNQFVYNQETFSIRSSALMAIEELMRLHKNNVTGPLIQSSFKRMQESAQLMQEKNPFWWKPREGCLCVLRSLHSFFSKTKDFDIVGLLNTLLQNDLADNCKYYYSI